MFLIYRRIECLAFSLTNKWVFSCWKQMSLVDSNLSEFSYNFDRWIFGEKIRDTDFQYANELHLKCKPYSVLRNILFTLHMLHRGPKLSNSSIFTVYSVYTAHFISFFPECAVSVPNRQWTLAHVGTFRMMFKTIMVCARAKKNV